MIRIFEDFFVCYSRFSKFDEVLVDRRSPRVISFFSYPQQQEVLVLTEAIQRQKKSVFVLHLRRLSQKLGRSGRTHLYSPIS